jgi:predicted PurR-regulated permease PerM
LDWFRRKRNLRVAAVLGVLLLALLCGIGIASAVNMNTTITPAQLWPAQTTVTNAPQLSVSSYNFTQSNYDSTLTNVNSITLNVTCSSGSHAGIVYVALGNTTSGMLGSGTSTNTTYSGSTLVNVTISPVVPLSSLDWVHLVITQTS